MSTLIFINTPGVNHVNFEMKCLSPPPLFTLFTRDKQCAIVFVSQADPALLQGRSIPL